MPNQASIQLVTQERWNASTLYHLQGIAPAGLSDMDETFRELTFRRRLKHKHTHTPTQPHPHTHSHTHAHTRTHTRTQAYTYTYTHTYIPTYT